jgi:hypothetical protein
MEVKFGSQIWRILLWLGFYFPDWGISGRLLLQTSIAMKNGPQTFGSLCKTQEGECLQFAQWLCDHWQIAAGICQGINVKSWSKTLWIWRTGFYIDGCATVWILALRWVIFKQKEGFAPISLGLIYHSSVADPGWFIPDPDQTIAPSRRIRGGKKAPDPGSYCT